jgi:hypothetical protein
VRLLSNSRASRDGLTPSPTCQPRQGGSPTGGCGHWQRKRYLSDYSPKFVGYHASGTHFAPPFVQAKNLMPLRGIDLPLEHSHFGFVDRLYVYLHVSKIRHLQNVGLSLHQVADELNKYRSTAMNAVPWNVQNVISVLKRDEQIKRADAFLLKTIEVSSLGHPCK